MARAYRMTPRRRAALRRAQLASAKKRRGKRNKAIAAGGLGVVGLAVGGVALSRRRRTSIPIKSKELVHVPGQGKVHTTVKQKPRANPTPRQFGPSSVIKVSTSGVAIKTTRGRMVYDHHRRRQYWRAKPVGGAPRKKYTSKKRGRR